MNDTTNRPAIRRAIDDVARMFGDGAEETIRYENGAKHVEEVEDILRSGPDSSVVDLGGGVGVNLLVLRQLGIRSRLVLVERFDEYDDSNRMGSADHARSLLDRADIQVVTADFWPDSRLPLETGSFDVACCYDVIEHLPGHPLRQLAELHRLLRVGGRILIGAPNAASLMKRLKLLAGRQPYSPYAEWITDNYYEHYREYLRHEYEDMLTRAGFDQVRSRCSAAVTHSRARNRYHRRIHARRSPTAISLWLLAAIESAVPSLRHTVYAEGRKSSA